MSAAVDLLRSSTGRLSTCHLVREGVVDHECVTPYPVLPAGAVVQCTCGRQYVSRRIDGPHSSLWWHKKWLRVRRTVTA